MAFKNRAYNIYIKAYDQEDQQAPIKEQVSLSTSEFGSKLIFGFFNLIKYEDEFLLYSKEVSKNTEFENILRALFSTFNLKHLYEQDGLENSIKRHIEQLKEFKFYLPDEFVGEDKRDLIPLEFDLGYKGKLEFLLNNIRNALKSLRNEKIQFWNTILEKYKQDKEAYDLEFRTKHLRREKDLDRISKITPEDVKDLL